MDKTMCRLSNEFFMLAIKALIVAIVNQSIVDFLKLQREIENLNPDTHKAIYKKKKQSGIMEFLDSDMVYSVTGLHGNTIVNKCLNGELNMKMFEYWRQDYV